MDYAKDQLIKLVLQCYAMSIQANYKHYCAECKVKLLQANLKHKYHICYYIYMLTTKLVHGFYYDATVVDYNLILKCLIIGDVKYPAHTGLQKIETHSTQVIQNKHEQVLCTCNVVYTI